MLTKEIVKLDYTELDEIHETNQLCNEHQICIILTEIN